ncbi:MAG: N5-carboxyaminoimidazole ribonucleotide mutase [Bacteroidota bacterium]|nr:MAG: N5-carboxyaminoimidazole ribonucleotide mutase [Bacteroidota bacterium]
MPGGVPVATVALNGAKNAALLACQILGVKNPALREAMLGYKAAMGEKVHQSAKELNQK